ncbi:hypothetical protein P43SY_001517 [Pythium insidiosum]|uniref:Uncharacterized protein n=1 Tax=Pythium insidiosum TaxID=114742 RepID=A0AAD5LX64_PYTIN|nr:hypothetical protein P43SY_001517 [Pythium insidiosum]
MHAGLVALTLGLPRWVLTLIWWYLLCYQFANGIMLSALAHLYWQADVRDSMLWFLQSYFLFSEAARFLSQMSRVVFSTYAVLAVLYFYGALSMVWHSLRRRQFCYDSGLKSSAATTTNHKAANTRASWKLPLLLELSRKGLRAVVRVWESFGIRGRHFVSGLIVREALETTLQTIQASWSAKRISSRAVNNLYVGLILVNCCSSYLYGYLFRAEQARRRLACVLTDLTIDFVWGTVIPVIMFMPYVRLYHAQSDIDINVVWPESAEKEVEQMLALSIGAFVLSVFPFVSSASNIRGLRRFLARAQVSSRSLQRVIPLDQGSREELEAVFDLFDDASLYMLELTDCSALDIPPAIHRFHVLATLSIRFSVVEKWSIDSALTAQHFSAIQTLRIIGTTLQTPPEGIYREMLPDTLEWISLSNVDVSSFIGDVGSNWRNVRFLYIDYAGLDNVPTVVALATSLLELSLCANPFVSFELETTDNLQHLTQLWLDSSHLQQLPDNVWQLARKLRLLSLQYTNVSTYPAWLEQRSVNDQLQVDAFGTPLCDPNDTANAIDTLPSLSCVEVENF